MVLEAAAFGEDGAEDAAEAGGIERTRVALDHGVKDCRFAGLIGDGQAMLLLEAGDFRDGLGSAIDEVEEFEIEFVDYGALLSKCLGHGIALLLFLKTKRPRSGIAAGAETVCEV
jgi:hypothetical protein